MTRREEIENNIGYKMTKAALEYVEKHEFADAMDAFEAGAEWMQKTMIDKACEWLDQNVVKYESGTRMGYIPFSFIEDMINDFRKAMEE